MSDTGPTTNAQIAARLLRDAAGFFRIIASENAVLKEQMSDNAQVFDEVAALVESDPTGIFSEG